jgi:hypothetical protein
MLRKIETIGKFLIGPSFIFGGIFFSYLSYVALQEGSDIDSWITATTTITYTYGVGIDDPGRGTGMSGGSGVKYILSPTYTFTASDGKTYVGHTYSQLGDKIDTRTRTEEDLKRKLVERGTIYYNPKNPNASSVQKPLFNSGAVFAFGLLSLMAICSGIHILVDENKQLKKMKAKNEEKHIPTFNFEHGDTAKEEEWGKTH